MKKWLLFALIATIVPSGCRRNRAPGQPSMPSGLVSAAVDTVCGYTSLADDPEGKPVAYRFDWGDGDTSDWTDPMETGQPGRMTHAWRAAGTYVVRAQAWDDHDALSSWSDGLSVNVAFSWKRTFGGVDFENAAAVRQTADGGYLIAGTTNSFGTGMNDVWLVKTDERGEKEWDMPCGGTNNDGCNAARQKKDGSYLLAGYTESYGSGGSDAFVVGRDSNSIWDLTLSGTGSEYATALALTYDGGCVLAINVLPQGEPDCDVRLQKLRGTEPVWLNTFGAEYDDKAAAVEQTADSGFIIAGTANASGVGVSDAWLVKTDSLGNQVWQMTYGGTGEEHAQAVDPTADGGYVFAGSTTSEGAGSSDYWLVKTDANGAVQWSKTFGGVDEDYAYSVRQTADGGLVVAGYTFSLGAGDADIWLIKTDAGGNKVWDKTYGGPDSEYGGFVEPTSDGGYIIGGNTRSYGAGMADFWLIKTNAEGD